MRATRIGLVLALAFHGVAVDLCPCVVAGRVHGACEIKRPEPSCCSRAAPAAGGPAVSDGEGCGCRVEPAPEAAPVPPQGGPTSQDPARAAAPAVFAAPAAPASSALLASDLETRGPAPPAPDVQAGFRVYRI